jgi:hypothetical protein
MAADHHHGKSAMKNNGVRMAASAKISISEMAAGSENGVSEKRKAKMAKMKAKRHETENNGARKTKWRRQWRK